MATRQILMAETGQDEGTTVQRDQQDAVREFPQAQGAEARAAQVAEAQVAQAVQVARQASGETALGAWAMVERMQGTSTTQCCNNWCRCWRSRRRSGSVGTHNVRTGTRMSG